MRLTIFAFTLLASLALLQPSCNDEPTDAVEVAKASEAEVLALCAEFRTGACAKVFPAGDRACTTCDPCGQAAAVMSIRVECPSPITLGDVRHCMGSGYDFATCTGPEMGGCVFDAFDELCPEAPSP